MFLFNNSNVDDVDVVENYDKRYARKYNDDDEEENEKMITKFYEIYEINTKVHTIHDYHFTRCDRNLWHLLRYALRIRECNTSRLIKNFLRYFYFMFYGNKLHKVLYKLVHYGKTLH